MKKPSLFAWLLPEPEQASAAELEIQMAAAENAHSEALDAVKKAQAVFDTDPSEEKQLLDAESLVVRATAHRDRAKRLLESGRAREGAARREVLLVQKSKLEAQLEADRRIAREDLPEKVAALLMEVTKAQADRELHEDKLSANENELVRVLRELDGLSESDPEFFSVAEKLKSLRPGYSVHTPILIWRNELKKIPVADERFSHPVLRAALAIEKEFER